MRELLESRIKDLDVQIDKKKSELDEMNKLTFSERYTSEFMTNKRILVGSIDALINVKQTNLNIIKGNTNANL